RLVEGGPLPRGGPALTGGRRADGRRGPLDPQLRPRRAGRLGRHRLRVRGDEPRGDPRPRGPRRPARRRDPRLGRDGGRPAGSGRDRGLREGRTMRRISRTRLALAALAAVAAAIGAQAVTGRAASGGERALAGARAATARYHDLATAQADHYGIFRDAAGIACIDNQPTGGMGIHYVNGGLVGDDVLDPAHPEALVYAPNAAGQVRLV